MFVWYCVQGNASRALADHPRQQTEQQCPPRRTSGRVPSSKATALVHLTTLLLTSTSSAVAQQYSTKGLAARIGSSSDLQGGGGEAGAGGPSPS